MKRNNPTRMTLFDIRKKLYGGVAYIIFCVYSHGYRNEKEYEKWVEFNRIIEKHRIPGKSLEESALIFFDIKDIWVLREYL